MEFSFVGRKSSREISLAVQWLRLLTSTAGGSGSIPGLGSKIPSAAAQQKKNAVGDPERNFSLITLAKVEA